MKLNFILFLLLSLCNKANFSKNILFDDQEYQEKTRVIQSLQGNWILYQNSKQEIRIKNDTIFHIENDKVVAKYLLLLSKKVVSNIFPIDTLTITNGLFFIEEVDIDSKIVESQYSLISCEKNKFVLSPMHSSELLTYNRKKHQ